MSNTIVMNTLTGAVTEYDWAFQSSRLVMRATRPGSMRWAAALTQGAPSSPR